MSLCFVIPVLNEERQLASSVDRVLACSERDKWPWSFEVVIADNGSTDATLAIARILAKNDPRIKVVSLTERGRGRALKMAWLQSSANVLLYSDVDLSTDIRHVPEMVAPILNGEVDITVGTRLILGSKVTRGLKRELISRTYNILAQTITGTRLKDLQCGFKAISYKAAREILPMVSSNNWFFDSEIAIKAEALGMRIRQVPVHWIDDPDSRVKVMSTALEQWNGLWRVRAELKNLSRANSFTCIQPSG